MGRQHRTLESLCDFSYQGNYYSGHVIDADRENGFYVVSDVNGELAEVRVNTVYLFGSKNKSVKPYLPSNSMNGVAFEQHWCQKCIREPVDFCNPELDHCPHLMKALISEHNGRWFWGNGKPVCTAFRDREEVYRRRRQRKRENPRQMELFC